MKYFLTTTRVWMLKRASRIEPHTTNRNEAIHPRRWKSASPQEYASTARATPKETRSASESYSAPKRDAELVSRAMRPSNRSRTAATKIRIAAVSNVPRIEHQTER